LFIWQNTFQRAIAILVGVVILGVTCLMVQQGVFARRVVIEVRQDPGGEGSGTFTVTDSGQTASHARVELGYADGKRVYQATDGAIPAFSDLRSVTIHVPVTKAQEIRIWLHRVTAEGQSENLPALVKVSSGNDIREIHVDGAGKQFVFPLREGRGRESKNSRGKGNQLEVEVQLAAHTT